VVLGVGIGLVKTCWLQRLGKADGTTDLLTPETCTGLTAKSMASYSFAIQTRAAVCMLCVGRRESSLSDSFGVWYCIYTT
jgi:hypothetical protein